jgi:hypothetical protein
MSSMTNEPFQKNKKIMPKKLYYKVKILINNCVVLLVHELSASWAYLCAKMYRFLW